MIQKISAKSIAIIGSQLLLALIFGFPLTKFGLGGVSWIFGGTASGVLVYHACRILYQYSLKPNRKARLLGQALVGIAIGFSIAHGNQTGIASQLPIFVLLTLFILISGGFIGYLYSRLSQTNILTAMLATVPGSVGIMSSLAADYGKNVSLVALIQIIRLTSVIFFIPIIARTIAGRGAAAALPVKSLLNFELSSFFLLLVLLILSFLTIRMAGIMRIPAPSFFGGLVVGLIFNPLLNFLPFLENYNFSPPPAINLIGQLLLGITIGEYWGSKPNLGKKTILYALMPVTMTIGAGFLAAAIARLLTPWDWLTCILVTAPGGAPEMILVALALEHNVEIVTAGHLVRLLAINASLPFWVLLFRYLDRHLPNSAND